MIKNIFYDLGNVILKDVPAIVLENIELTVGEKISAKNLGFENNIKSIPLYAAFLIN